MPKSPVTPGLQPGYHLAATGKCWSRGQILKRTYDWSHRSWMIARAKSVATRWMVMLKTSNLRFQIASGRRLVLRDRTTSRVWSHHQLWIIADHAVARLVVQLVVSPDDWWCHPLYDIMFGKATIRDLSRFVARLWLRKASD